MSSQGPYRSRLFRYTSRQYRRAIDRSQRTWRQVKAAAQWGLHAVALPFLQLWKTVERSNFQLGAPPAIKSLLLPATNEKTDGTVSKSLLDQVFGQVQARYIQPEDSADEAIARVLQQLTILPVDAEAPTTSTLPQRSSKPTLALKAASSTPTPEEVGSSRYLEAALAPTATALARTSATTALSESGSSELGGIDSTKMLVTSPLAIRAIASDLGQQSLVMVSSSNDILDLLSADQQDLLAQRIWQEVALLEQPAAIIFTPFPLTWRDTLDRLSTLTDIARDHLRTLPAASPKLLDAPRQQWQALGDRLPEALPNISQAAQQTFTNAVEPLLETLKTSTADLADTASEHLALPAPVRDIAQNLPEQLGTITTQIGSSLNQLNEKLADVKAAALPSPLTTPQDSPWWDPPSLDSAVSAAQSISSALPQPMRRIISPLLPQSPITPKPTKSATPSPQAPTSLPTPKSAWAKPLVPKQPLATSAIPTVSALPPSSESPQLFLNPPAEGFLRAEVRRSLNNRYRKSVTQKLATQTTLRSRSIQSPVIQSPNPQSPQSIQPARHSTLSIADTRTSSTQRPLTSRPKRTRRSVATTASNTRQASAPVPLNSARRGTSIKRSPSSRSTSVEAQPSYIEVDAKPMGYETPAMRKGLNWLDRGVYIAEESALQAWEWWCDFIQSSDSPDAPAADWSRSLLPSAQAGGGAIANSTPSRWRSASSGAAEFTLSVLQHLLPVLVKTSILLARLGTWLSLKLLYWLWSEVLPIVVGLTIDLTRWGLKTGIRLIFRLIDRLSAKS